MSENLIVDGNGAVECFLKAHGKIPDGKESDRKPYLDSSCIKGDILAKYREHTVVMVDVDDRDHRTGELVDSVHGHPRSEVIEAILNKCGIKYNEVVTECGRHFIFRLSSNFTIEKNCCNWLCAIGVKCEWKVTKVCEPMRVNGIDRKWVKGSVDNLDIDELPPFLWPIQKTKEKPFHMDFTEGGRNNALSSYALYLPSKFNISADETVQAIRLMNEFVLEDPLPDEEIDLILRPETLEKMKQIQGQKENSSVSPETFQRFINSLGMSIKYNELLNIVEYANLPKTPQYQNITDIQNVMPIQLMYDFRKFTGKGNITKHQVIDLILLEADQHSYNPVKDFLKSVSWDGFDRFPKLFDILGVADDLQKSLIRKWFYQTAYMPFNAMEDPFQAEGVLILQGSEGIGKTRFFQQIAVNPLWFSSLDKELTTKNKDVLIQILSVWIAEIGEIDRTFKANISDVKSFITSRDDTIRKPYRMEQVKKARTTSFCGSTNKSAFLNDDTGSRRWWIIPVKKKIHLGSFAQKENLIQFWSQCYSECCKNPECFRLADSEMEQLKEVNRESTILVPAEEELRSSFNFDAPRSEWNWTTASALKELPEYNVSSYDVRQIGKALGIILDSEPKMEKKRTNKGTKYFIPPSVHLRDRYGNTPA